MKYFRLILMCICMTVVIAAGCSKGAKTSSGNGEGDVAMKELCNKSVKESADVSSDITKEMQNMMMKWCENSDSMFKGNDHALEAFANHILSTCEGKTGKDWMDCYTQELPVAQQKAADAPR